MSSTLPDSHDTALARVLHSESLLPLEVIQAALNEVRLRRVKEPGASLANTLLARGQLTGAELDRANSLLGLQAAFEPAAPQEGGFGPYRIVREIARGGMGVVYEVVHGQIQARGALKTLLVGQGADPDELARFRREAEALGRLEHPNVVRVLAADVFGRTPYLVQELLPGGTLDERVKRSPLTPSEAARVTQALAEGLAHCHAAGLLHRDLKPANVLFDGGGTPKLVDFGLVFSSEASQRLTATGTLLGTPSYMAPEQALGLKEVDARTDVYGLGGILYFLLCRRPPFAGGLYQTLEQVVHSPPEPPRAINPEVSPALEAICLRALAKDPADRFQDMAAFAAALASEAAEPEAGAPRRGALAAGVLVVALLVVGGLLALAASGPRQSPAVTPAPSASEVAPASPLDASPEPVTSPPVEGLGELLETWEPGPGALSFQGFDLARVGSQVVSLERGGATGARLSPAELHSRRPGLVRVWSLKDGKELRRLDLSLPSELFPTRLAGSRDGARIAVGGARRVAVYETTGWTRIALLERAGEGRLRALEFSPSGNRLAIASGHKGAPVRVYDLTRPAAPARDLPFTGGASAFVDEGTLAVVTRAPKDPRGTLVFWSLGGERQLLSRVQAVKGDCLDLEVTRDGRRLFAAGWEGKSVTAWDLVGDPSDWGPTKTVVVGVEVTRIRLGPREEKLLVTTGRSHLFEMDPRSLDYRLLGKVEERSARDALFLDKGRVLTVGIAQRVRLLDSRLRPLWPIGAKGPLRTLSRCGRGILVANDRELRVLGGELVELALGLPRQSSEAQVVRLTRDASRAWCLQGKWLGVYELAAEGRATLRGRFPFLELPKGLAISPLGQHVVLLTTKDRVLTPSYVQYDGKHFTISPLEKSPLQPRAGWRYARPPVIHVGASGLAVLGDDHGAIQTWDLETLQLGEGLEGGRFRRERPAIVSLADIEDLILAGDDSGRIRLWRPGSEELAPLFGHRGPVFALCPLPGARLASVAEDGDLVIWDLRKGWQLARKRISVGVPHLLHYGEGVLTVATTDGHVQAFAFR